MTSPTSPEPALTRQQKAEHREMVSRVKSIWRSNDAPDAVAFLRENSSLRKDRALTIELAYEEYCIRRDNGEPLGISMFCDRFPSISRSLHRQIEVHEYVLDHAPTVERSVPIAWPRRGDRLFGVVVVEEIGRGAFARAYLCAQPGIGNREVVVKVSTGGAIEADTMGGLDHTNIMPVYSVQVDKASSLSGICMPFVGRSTLYDVIDVAFGQGQSPRKSAVIFEASRALSRRGDRYHQLTPRMNVRPGSPYATGALQIALQLAEALAHSHERGVLHGDLKPSNVVMSVGGIPMLVDFNLAQSRGSDNFVMGGTLPYMAPEQIRSMLLGADKNDGVDQRSDVYSWGVILYELLTGRLPFDVDNSKQDTLAAAGRMLDAQSSGIASTNRFGQNVDSSVIQLVKRCLAFDVRRRPRDMSLVVRELKDYLSWRRRSGRYVRQHRPLVAAIAVGFAGTLLALSLGFALRPPLRDRSYQAGARAYQRQDYASAIESLNRAIGEDVTFADAYLARACAAMQRFEHEKFDALLDSAYKDFTMAARYRDQPAVRDARAYCLIRMHQYGSAARDLESLHQQGHVTASTANNLAYCYEKIVASESGDRDRVEQLAVASTELLRTAMTLADNLPQPHLNLAILELRRYRSGITGFVPADGFKAAQKAIEIGDASPVACVCAAKLAGILADERGDDAFFDVCLDYLEMAVRRGHKLRSYDGQFPPPFDRVADRPRFQALLQNRVAVSPKAAERRIIEPEVISSPFSPGDASWK